MMKSKHFLRKPNALLLTSMLLGTTWIMPTSAAAAETLFSKARFTELMHGDVQLAPIGHRAGLHMTFKSPSNSGDAYSAVHADNPGGSGSAVRLSVRVPWK